MPNVIQRAESVARKGHACMSRAYRNKSKRQKMNLHSRKKSIVDFQLITCSSQIIRLNGQIQRIGATCHVGPPFL